MKTRSKDGRWETEFGKWVAEYGVDELAVDLDCTVSAVYFWLRLNGRIVYPDPDKAIRITELSGGRLTLEDVFLHRRRAAARAAAAGQTPN